MLFGWSKSFPAGAHDAHLCPVGQEDFLLMLMMLARAVLLVRKDFSTDAHDARSYCSVGEAVYRLMLMMFARAVRLVKQLSSWCSDAHLCPVGKEDFLLMLMMLARAILFVRKFSS